MPKFMLLNNAYVIDHVNDMVFPIDAINANVPQFPIVCKSKEEAIIMYQRKCAFALFRLYRLLNCASIDSALTGLYHYAYPTWADLHVYCDYMDSPIVELDSTKEDEYLVDEI